MQGKRGRPVKLAKHVLRGNSTFLLEDRTQKLPHTISMQSKKEGKKVLPDIKKKMRRERRSLTRVFFFGYTPAMG